MCFSCGCQLSQNPQDYVWAKCKTNEPSNFQNDFQDEYYIYIAPADDFHWDGGLTHIIPNLIPQELSEASESIFDFVETNDNKIENIMDRTGMIYSENLRKIVENDNNFECICKACVCRELFDKLDYVDIGQEKCSQGRKHIVSGKLKKRI